MTAGERRERETSDPDGHPTDNRKDGGLEGTREETRTEGCKTRRTNIEETKKTKRTKERMIKRKNKKEGRNTGEDKKTERDSIPEYQTDN